MASNPSAHPAACIPIHPPPQTDWWTRGLSFLSLWGNIPAPDSEPGTSGEPSPTTEFSASPAALFLSGFSSPPPPPQVVPNLVPPALPTSDPDVVGGYSIGRTIGHGGFSTIKLATAVKSPGASPPSIAAVKIVRKLDSRPGIAEARRRLSHEATIWKQLSHEHILPLFHAVETDNATYLFTLYCPEGSLLDIINSHAAGGGLMMDDAGMLFRQVVRGLRYLHEVMGLVHGDLKLENVLVDESGSCRISDFGLAQWMESRSGHAFLNDISSDDEVLPPSRANSTAPLSRNVFHANNTKSSSLSIPTQRQARRKRGRRHRNHHRDITQIRAAHSFLPGSLPYAAPEMLNPHPSNTPYPSPTQDIWALGCILYALLFGKLPFEDPFEPRLQMKIRRGIWHLPGYRAGSRSRPRQSARTRSSSRNTRQQSRSRSKSRQFPLKSPINGDHTTLKVSTGRSKSRGRSLRSPLSGGPASRSTSLKRIGRVAEDVLKGCLCVDPASRWTVSMVDEVGWGVGWDLEVGIEEGDDLESSEVSTTPSPASESSAASSSAPHRLFEGTALPPAYSSAFGQDPSVLDNLRCRSRSRGKRGKASRSSSVARAAAGQSSCSAECNTPDVTHDPFSCHTGTLTPSHTQSDNDHLTRHPPIEPSRHPSQNANPVPEHYRGRLLRPSSGRPGYEGELGTTRFMLVPRALDHLPSVHSDRQRSEESACSPSPSPTPRTPLDFHHKAPPVELANQPLGLDSSEGDGDGVNLVYRPHSRIEAFSSDDK